MNSIDLERLQILLKEKEGLTSEFKESFSSKLDKDIVAFANSCGGRIFLGVNDQGEVIGENLTNDLKAKISSLARNCEPSVVLKNIEQIGKLVVITVEESREKPHSCSTGYYRRLDAVTQKMNQKELKLLFKKTENAIPFERLFCPNVSFSNISKDKIKYFLSEARIKIDTFNIKEVMNSLSLAENDNINNAGVLFFSEKPKRHIFHCEMILVAFKGVDRINVYDRINVKDDLVTQFNKAIFFLKKHLNTRSEIRGVKRYEICEIPIEALREAVANAIIHRDYSIQGTSLMVEVYEDRITIKNPGGFPQGMDIKLLMRTSVRRNELIADIFARIGKAERIASGLNRIMKLLSAAGLPEPTIESGLFFEITFKRDKRYTSATC